MKRFFLGLILLSFVSVVCFAQFNEANAQFTVSHLGNTSNADKFQAIIVETNSAISQQAGGSFSFVNLADQPDSDSVLPGLNNSGLQYLKRALQFKDPKSGETYAVMIVPNSFPIPLLVYIRFNGQSYDCISFMLKM
jgi:hypothetical protein